MGYGQDEQKLVQRAREGDAEAFIALCEPHRARLWRVVASVAIAAEHDDLAQEAIVRAFASIRSYRGDTPFAAWLCRIALNAAHDYQRSAWRRRVVPLAEAPAATLLSAEPCTVAEDRERQRRVRQSVAALPERQRTAIWLRYFEDFSLVEIALLEKTPESTVRSRIAAGLKRLAALLNDLDERADLGPAASALQDRVL